MELPTLSDSDKKTIVLAQMEIAQSIERVAKKLGSTIDWVAIEKLSKYPLFKTMLDATLLKVKKETQHMGTNFGVLLFQLMNEHVKLFTDGWTAPTKASLGEYMPTYIRGLKLLAGDKQNDQFDAYTKLMKADPFLKGIRDKTFGAALDATIANNNFEQSAKGLGCVWQRTLNNIIRALAKKPVKTFDFQAVMDKAKIAGSVTSTPDSTDTSSSPAGKTTSGTLIHGQ
jgi:hypothetical protein